MRRKNPIKSAVKRWRRRSEEIGEGARLTGKQKKKSQIQIAIQTRTNKTAKSSPMDLPIATQLSCCLRVGAGSDRKDN